MFMTFQPELKFIKQIFNNLYLLLLSTAARLTLSLMRRF